MSTVVYKKYSPYYWKRYYRSYRYRRTIQNQPLKSRYTTGKYNYMRMKFDITGVAKFPSQESGNIQFTFPGIDPGSITSIGILLKNSPGHQSVATLYSERKITGIRYEIMPLNDGTITSTTNVINVAGFLKVPTNLVSYNTLSQSNVSVIFNANGKATKYTSIPGAEYKAMNYEDVDEGLFGMAASNNSKLSDYGRSYSVKITLYTLLRGVQI